MAQRNNEQVTPALEGTVMPPELYIERDKPKRERVVQGTNEPVSPEFLKTAIAGWLFFLGVVGALLLAMSIGLEWKMGAVFIVYLLASVTTTLVMWKIVLPYMTGDNVAEKEISKERDTELAHIAAERDVRMKYLEVEDKKVEYWREVETLKVSAQQDQLDISTQVAQLKQLVMDNLHMLPADRGRSFVPAHDLSAKLRVKEWMEELYETEGAITSSGKVRKKMPQWSKEEERYILELFVAPTRNGEWWEVVHDDKFSALTALNNMDKGA